VHPAVLEALVLPGAADVLVTVRSWARDVAFEAGLALAGDRAVAMVRRWDVLGPPGRPVRSPRGGLELSAFAAGRLLDEVMRVLPPERVGGAGEAGGTLDLRPLDVVALVAAVREGRDDVAQALAQQAGLDGVPGVLEDLALHRDGAVEVVVRRPDAAVPAVTGSWWLAGGRWLRAVVTRGSGQDPLTGLLSTRATSRGDAREDLRTALVSQLEPPGAGGSGRG
jgi:hypothetical protein